MKKMKTLFVRKFDNHEVIKCLNQIEKDCEWVLNGEGYATEKIDGTCCMIKENKLYKRYDAKKGKVPPVGAIPCQEKADEITGHFPHWVLCEEKNPSDKYHIEAFRLKDNWEDGTYELIGKHFQNNPYNLSGDILEKHGIRILENVPRTYEGIKQYLLEHCIEGIVFYRGNGEMCKIKRSDFGYDWKSKKVNNE